MINKPTSKELIDLSNEFIENENEKVKSRYTIIMATSKRAKQLIDDENIEIEGGNNPLSLAVNEFKNKQVHIIRERDE